MLRLYSFKSIAPNIVSGMLMAIRSYFFMNCFMYTVLLTYALQNLHLLIDLSILHNLFLLVHAYESSCVHMIFPSTFCNDIPRECHGKYTAALQGIMYVSSGIIILDSCCLWKTPCTRLFKNAVCPRLGGHRV